MSMLERVAFRIFVKTGRTHAIGSAEDSWERSAGTIVRRECEDLARAVLEEMREPADAMLPPEGVHIGFFNDADGLEDNIYIDRDEARDVWQAMIDTALNK